jgi:arginine-tRNA-protein transferase
MSRNHDTSSEEEEEEDLEDFGLTMISIAGPSKHDCGYCKGKDTSISFGIWAHSMTCSVRIDIVHFIFYILNAC